MANEIPMIEEPSEGKIITIVADDLEIRGTIKFKTSVMLKGIVEGEIFSEGLLVVGPTAKVTATISTETLISHGEVTGNITALKQVVLRPTATHTGDIKTPFIMIENGAIFNGACTMERGKAAVAMIPETITAAPEPVEIKPEPPAEIRQETKKRQPREKAVAETPDTFHPTENKEEEQKPPSGELL